MRLILVSVLVSFALGAPSGKVRYDGHKLFRALATNQDQMLLLERLRENADFGVDFWTSAAMNRPVDVHVAPSQEAGFLKVLDENDISHEVILKDIQKLIDEEDLSLRLSRQKAGVPYNIVGTFARSDEISTWLDSMALQHSDIASIDSLGTSYEGRDLKLIKIGRAGSNKQKVFIDAGIHAREWITQSSAVWIINQLLTEYGKDSEITQLLNTYDFYIAPNMNPDGYEYSHTSERLWRKTRKPNPGSFCAGVDGNRNFDYPVFGGPSTSTNPCSDLYKGASAFSEPETAALKDYLTKIGSETMLYIALHSYTQLILTPWGFQAERPEDGDEMDRVGKVGADAIYSVNQRFFTVGTPPSILYAAGGGAYDWVKGTAGVKYSYTFELRPDSNAFLGFILNPSNIEPSGREIWQGIKAMVNEISSQ